VSRPRYDLEDRLIDFAVRICGLLERFPSGPVSAHVAKQLLRCGTAPFANYGEAQAAESRGDFLHKLRICLKELRETQTWLKFIRRMNLSGGGGEEVEKEAAELVAIFTTSVETTRRKCKMSNVKG